MSQLPEKTQAWLPEPLSDEVRRSIERLARLDNVARIALMPDVHLAENVCIGAVVASHSGLYPDAVGGDIGCGMATVQLDAHAGVVNRRSAERILEALAKAVPTHRHRQKQALPPELAAAKLSTPALQKALERHGAVQLGTLGSGNHFLELQADEEGRLWLTVHTGFLADWAPPCANITWRRPTRWAAVCARCRGRPLPAMRTSATTMWRCSLPSAVDGPFSKRP